MPDEMFFANEERSLVRGKRVAPRTDTCRPCLVEALEPSIGQFEGVVLDITPYGMLVRMLEPLPLDTTVRVQLMRDENFMHPLSGPRTGAIVRHEETADGFIDHGVKLNVESIRRPVSRPVALDSNRYLPERGPARMHTIDFTIGGGQRRNRR